MPDIYERLARFLDETPAGYPSTESGVELRILRKLFTPQEAELFLSLTLLGEEPRVIAFRARQPEGSVAQLLDVMEQKGLVSGNHRTGKPTEYALNQFVIGFWEEQVNQLDRELAVLFEEYHPHFVKKGSWTTLPQLRTIPIGASIQHQHEVMPYESAEAILRKHRHFAVRNCVCRQERQVLGKGCNKPMETCLSLGDHAHHAVQSGKSRYISLDEALAILKLAEESGLVLQPSNSKDPIAICACCGCCCGVLRGLKYQDHPGQRVANAYIARHDPDLCSGCGLCLDRCQMEALIQGDVQVEFKPERCIGCGLCVSTCPSEALTLVRKPGGELPDIPFNTTTAYIGLGLTRGKWNLVKLVGLAVKSKTDRLLAPRKTTRR